MAKRTGITTNVKTGEVTVTQITEKRPSGLPLFETTSEILAKLKADVETLKSK